MFLKMQRLFETLETTKATHGLFKDLLNVFIYSQMNGEWFLIHGPWLMSERRGLVWDDPFLGHEP